MKTLINKVTMDWLKAAAIRAIRTMAQTALAMVTVGASLGELDWLRIGSVSLVAGIASVLTSLATKLPEIGTDGVLEIDTTGEKELYRFNMNTALADLSTKNHVTLKIDPTAKISQE